MVGSWCVPGVPVVLLQSVESVSGTWPAWDRGGGTGVLHVSGKFVDKLLNVVYLYVYLNTD